MITNADITLYHKGYDPQTRLDTWAHTQYPKVNWHGHQAATVSDKGLSTADAYTVRIPTAQAVLIAIGDIVTRGLLCEADPKRAKGPSFVVTSVADNRRGTLCHWKIEGK